jgi:hypothetical protein
VSDSTFYSDRVGHARPRVSEEVSPNAWPGLVALIQARILDGSLARAFPRCDCPDGRDRITGTDEDMFLDSVLAHIPELEGRILEADVPPRLGICLLTRNASNSSARRPAKSRSRRKRSLPPLISRIAMARPHRPRTFVNGWDDPQSAAR